MKQNNNNHPKVFEHKKSPYCLQKIIVVIDLQYYLLQFDYQSLQYSTIDKSIVKSIQLRDIIRKSACVKNTLRCFSISQIKNTKY